MIPDSKVVNEGRERVVRVKELSTRLDNFMGMLTHYQTLAATKGPKQEEYLRKVHWIASEIPSKLAEFQEAAERMNLSLDRFSPPSSRQTVAVRSLKTPATRPYLQAVK